MRETFHAEPSDICAEIIKNGRIEGCKSQEGGLALLWTLGIFALNIGPVPMGPVLDFFGPRYTSVLGMPCALILTLPNL